MDIVMSMEATWMVEVRLAILCDIWLAVYSEESPYAAIIHAENIDCLPIGFDVISS